MICYNNYITKIKEALYMAQSVIVKKEEKVNSVFGAMQNIDDMNEFKQLFKSMYPKDWERVKVQFTRDYTE